MDLDSQANTVEEPHRGSWIRQWGRKLRSEEESDLLKVAHLLALVNLRALPQSPLPPGLVRWQHPVPADLSLRFISISHPWLRCCLSLPMATITPQCRADLPSPLARIGELRAFCALFHLKTEANGWGQTEKASDYPSSPLCKTQHRVPSWPQTDLVAGIFSPFVSQWPSRKGNQSRVPGLLKFYFRVREKSKLSFFLNYWEFKIIQYKKIIF